MAGQSDRELLAGLSTGEVEALVALLTRVVVEVLRRADGASAASSAGGVARIGAAPATTSVGERATAQGVAHRFAGPVLVEQDVRDARSRGVGTLWLSAATLVSPLAVDAARAWGLELEREV